MTEPSVSGMSQLVDVLEGGRLVKPLLVLLGILCLICVFLPSLRKFRWSVCKVSLFCHENFEDFLLNLNQDLAFFMK